MKFHRGSLFLYFLHIYLKYRNEVKLMGKYLALFLDKDESNDPRKKGYAYAKMNEDRFVDVSEFKDDFLCGYDRSLIVFTYKGIAYNVFKEYAELETGNRIYVCCDLNLAYDSEDRTKTELDPEYREQKMDIIRQIAEKKNQMPDKHLLKYTIEELQKILNSL